MTTKLKIGQRIGVYNVIGAEILGFAIKGKTIVADEVNPVISAERYDIEGHFCAFHGYPPSEKPEYISCGLHNYEVKKVGVFVIRELKTNTDPITII